VLDEDVRLLTIVAGMLAHDVRARRVAAAERTALEEENTRLRSELADRFRPENIIGNSNAMREVYRSIGQVAPSDTPCSSAASRARARNWWPTPSTFPPRAARARLSRSTAPR
jgi:hypothetical protein